MTDEGRVDWAAARKGALVDLAVLVPVVALYTLVRATGLVKGDAAAGVTAVLAVFAAPAAGGWVAAKEGPAAPLTNSAVASAIGVVAYAIFRAVDALVREQQLSVSAVVILVMVSVVIGVIGGAAAGRVQRRHR